jgi:hypothetical protein
VGHIGCSRPSEQQTGRTVSCHRLPQHSSDVLERVHTYIHTYIYTFHIALLHLLTITGKLCKYDTRLHAIIEQATTTVIIT